MAANGVNAQESSVNKVDSAAEDPFGVGVQIEASHPLYLAPGATSVICLISFQLSGTNNYSLWSRFMRIALLGRNKWGLVDGSWMVLGAKISFMKNLVINGRGVMLLSYLG